MLLFGQTNDAFIVSDLRCDLTLFWGNVCSFHGLYVKVDSQRVHRVLMRTRSEILAGKTNRVVMYTSAVFPTSPQFMILYLKLLSCFMLLYFL